MTETETDAQTKPKTTAQIAKSYFNAIAAQDLDLATSLWKPGSKDRLHGLADLTAPADIKTYFSGLFSAFPDFKFEVLELAATGKSAACRWRVTGTFLGPGRFQGLAPTGASIVIEGCDMLRVEDGRIVENNAYMNAQQIAEQLGVMPPQDSTAGRAMITAFNAKTAAAAQIRKLRDRT